MISSALLCLALNIFHEARGEPVHGQYAVAMVTLNRAEGKKERVCDEVFKPSQFSWANSGVRRVEGGWMLSPRHSPGDKAAWAASKQVAALALQGRVEDFTGGATFYHERKWRPAWRRSMVQVAQVGNHVFYKLPA